MNTQALHARLDALVIEIDTLTVSRRKLKERQETLRRERDSIRRFLANPPNGKIRNAQSDLFCVPSILLIQIVDLYLDQSGETATSLCARAETDPAYLRKLRRGEIRFSTTILADALLTAMGQQDKLGVELPIVPNPYKSYNADDVPTGY